MKFGRFCWGICQQIETDVRLLFASEGKSTLLICVNITLSKMDRALKRN